MNPPVEAPTSRQARPFGIEAEGVEGGGELHSAARDVGVRRLGFDRRGLADRLGRLPQRLAVDPDQAGGDRGLRRARLGK